MSNISTAKTSLHAELAHVQSGLAYYQARVEALTAAIDQLESIGDESDTDMGLEEGMHEPKIRRGRRGRRAGATAARPSAAARRAAKPAARRGRSAGRMPATGGDFFPNLINEQKQSMSDLLHAAAAKLPFKATDEEMTQLRSRLVAAVGQMLKSGKIHDEGKGRARVYFRG
jgi:hypothetical protein